MPFGFTFNFGHFLIAFVRVKWSISLHFHSGSFQHFIRAYSLHWNPRWQATWPELAFFRPFDSIRVSLKWHYWARPMKASQRSRISGFHYVYLFIILRVNVWIVFTYSIELIWLGPIRALSLMCIHLRCSLPSVRQLPSNCRRLCTALFLSARPNGPQMQLKPTTDTWHCTNKSFHLEAFPLCSESFSTCSHTSLSYSWPYLLSFKCFTELQTLERSSVHVKLI